ncbi:MAG TPA: glutamine amidotransferase, partial [Rhodanobacteraceae bacterium]|nr:glutamine amidotransferase [Rhodanobacteraceae bacterium]
MQSLLLIQTGEAPEVVRAQFGGFAEWFRSAMRLQPAQMRVVRVDEGETLPHPGEVSGAVITGSAAMVTERADWSERTADWIRAAMDVQTPLFGVCYGHQLMAHALGGRVDVLPGGREVGTQDIEVFETGADDHLLAGLPMHFAAHTTHVQSVLEAPTDAQVLARSARDPHHILRYGPNAFSTQLHPEFSTAVMRAYLRLRADNLRSESLDVAALLDAVRATPHARRLLRRFALQTTTMSTSCSMDAVA